MRAVLPLLVAVANLSAAEPFVPQTRVGLEGTRWTISGSVTYPGTPAEGLLMNVRMVNATFEDANKPEFDADANTDTFLKALPDYVAHGVRGFTFNLQGGHAGYEGPVNSAYEPDGTLRPGYMARVARVIEECDRRGCVVILGCFYQRQDQRLRDEAAVRAGLVNAASWVKGRGYTNVVLEVANEYPIRGFDHAILSSPAGEAELIRLAKRAHPGLLVSTSGVGNGRLDPEVCETADFLLIHFNGTPVEKIPERVEALKKYGKPIVCNEDDKNGETAARAAAVSVEHGCSWGLMLNDKNQYVPFEFDGAADDPAVYKALRRLTSAGERRP